MSACAGTDGANGIDWRYILRDTGLPPLLVLGLRYAGSAMNLQTIRDVAVLYKAQTDAGWLVADPAHVDEFVAAPSRLTGKPSAEIMALDEDGLKRLAESLPNRLALLTAIVAEEQ